MTTARETLHRLVDELPEQEIATAARFLDYLRTTAHALPRALADHARRGRLVRSGVARLSRR